MNSYDLSIEPNELRNYATGMQKDLENMISELDTVTGTINDTTNSFIGVGADAIREKYGLLSKNFSAFREVMEEYIKFLQTVANIYENQDKKIQQNAQNL